MTEWCDLPTMQDVAAAQAAGDEITVRIDERSAWLSWVGNCWREDLNYRARPRKPVTRVVVLRRALMRELLSDNYYGTNPTSIDYSSREGFVMWLPGEETVEVPV